MIFQRHFHRRLPRRIFVTRARPSGDCLFLPGIIDFSLKETAIHHRSLVEILPCVRRSDHRLLLSILVRHYQLGQQRLTVAEEVPVFSGISGTSAPPAFGQHRTQCILPSLYQLRHVVHLIQVCFIILCHARIEIILSYPLPVEIHLINTAGSDIQPCFPDFIRNGRKFRTQHRHGIAARVLHIPFPPPFQSGRIQCHGSQSVFRTPEITDIRLHTREGLYILQGKAHLTHYGKGYEIASLPQGIHIHFPQLHVSFFQGRETQVGIQRESMRLILVPGIQHVIRYQKRFQRYGRLVIGLITRTIKMYPCVSTSFQRRQVELHLDVRSILPIGKMIQVLVRIHQPLVIRSIHKGYLTGYGLLLHLERKIQAEHRQIG